MYICMKFLRKFIVLLEIVTVNWVYGAEISPALKDADEKLTDMRTVQTILYSQLEKAEKDQNADIRKINCLKRKKGTIDGLIKATDRVRSNLLNANSKSDQEAV